MGAPVLIGAGVGALGSALSGQNPLKGALIGGGLGGAGAGIQSLMQGGSFMSGALPFMSETVKPAAMASIAQGGGAAMPAYSAPIGMANTFDLATNATVNAANQAGTVAEFAPAMFAATPAAGGLTAAATSVPFMQQLGYTMDEVKSMLPEMSAANVIGGLGVANQYANSRRPTVQAPAGGISRANPPSGEALTQLLNSVAAQPRKRISLLVG